MLYKISYAKAAIKAMARLDRPIRERIRKWIEEELPCKEEVQQSGKDLKGNLAGLYRYRVGDYRVIVKIEHGILTILILDVGPRGSIYKN